MKSLQIKEGTRFGKWKVLSQADSKKGSTYWKCRCDCGVERIVRGISIVGKKSLQCGQCARSENGKKNRKDDKHVAVSNIIKQYKANAKSRGVKFALERKDFESLIFQNCHYCDVRPNNVFTCFQRKNQHKHGSVSYNGIDRIDNQVGYENSNCVTCCAQCNWAKKDLSQSQFLDWVRNVYVNKLSGIRDKTAGMIADELVTTLIKCFMAQEDIMNPNLEESARSNAAKRAQELNARRNRLIRAFDEIFGFKEVTYTDKTYG